MEPIDLLRDCIRLAKLPFLALFLRANWLLPLIVLSLAGCGLAKKIDPEKIISINIIDRNGMSETINSKERLNAFEKTNFLDSQPYQKVMRVYGKQENGNIKSCITSYHPNGQIKQYLEALNNRAFGTYREWHPNGTRKVEASIIGGMADINTTAEQSWIFEGTNRAWDEDGNLIAEIQYIKGDLHGPSIYYHPNGCKWKMVPYKNNKLDGNLEVYLEDGALFQVTAFQEGIREGESCRYWPSSKLAFQEKYKKNLLVEATYYDKTGSVISNIYNGKGQRAVFGKIDLLELQEYQNGIQEGRVRVFDENQQLLSVYSIKNGEKEGEQIDYFTSSKQPHLLMHWQEGLLTGPMKTWYENGQLESQREMSKNSKQGFLTAWYKNGALMLIEEYDNDKLLKGEYYKVGEKTPVSQIERGKGVATLFNADGAFSKKICYYDGKPTE